ncbi:MAG: glycine cleavage system aminomethyltransferase GcvT [Gemmatimonadota bacterium]|nr:MAG: glycine cleavage system aminomethyltransferase GcvT [Gemmatimonadota bacterium]
MAENLNRTPLHAEHVKLGAKMIPFAGFEMPVQYATGISSEHRWVREHAGLFDVSHMGEFKVAGDGALEFVNHVVANDVSRLEPGRAQYTVMCQEDGGIIDDFLVYRFPDRYRLVVNAANIGKDFKWIQHCLAEWGQAGIELVDESDAVGLLALQGPESEAILEPLTDLDVSAIKYYRFAEGRVAGVACVVSRTGYTGEDGFELYCTAAAAAKLWQALMQAGAERIKPIVLGARDTLRLEVGLALYGNDIDEDTTPLEAGLGWTVKLDKGDFIGQAALLKQKEEGVGRKLCGFVLKQRGFPRPGHEIRCQGKPAGVVRSGTVGPSVGQGIGTGYLPTEWTSPGTEIEIVIRDRAVPAEVVRMPFYKGGSVRR